MAQGSGGRVEQGDGRRPAQRWDVHGRAGEVVEAVQRAHTCALAREGREDDGRVKTTTRQVA